MVKIAITVTILRSELLISLHLIRGFDFKIYNVMPLFSFFRMSLIGNINNEVQSIKNSFTYNNNTSITSYPLMFHSCLVIVILLIFPNPEDSLNVQLSSRPHVIC